ncbi:MAG: hypothetical protein C0467_30650 [Planctomycetaceae bacterium]|nr:hypothetical protein [Planctomycetaceae bacterium]
MSDYWDTLSARSDGAYASEDFEAAAYRLISEQSLYHADKLSRNAYNLVERYEREFDKVLSPFGVQLKVNRVLRYVVALPTHAKATPANKAQTLFALVLRGIYEESARVGYLSEDGEVLCDLIELGEKYRLMTAKELPAKGEFDSLMKMARRWGIARRLDDAETGSQVPGADGQMGGIAIRPAIVDVLGETALRRLVHWQEVIAKSDESVGPIQETEEDADEAA